MAKNVLTKAQRDRLIRFNNAFDDLMELPFVKDISGKKHSKNINYKFDKPGGRHAQVTLEIQGHDPSNVRAATTIIRHFVYDGKEKISLAQMHEIYQAAAIDMVYKKRIDQIRDIVNDILNRNATLFLTLPMTNDTILRTILYGMLIHLDKKKADTIARWKRDAAVWQEIWHEFENIMNRLVIAMKIIRENNLEILAKFGRLPT